MPSLPHPSDKPVTAAVIGTGHFATAVVTQAEAIPHLQVPILVDLDLSAAQRAYARAGVDPDLVTICESRTVALRALERQRRVILTDADLLWELPVDVVLESTGVPEAGARHALAAIDHRKHVVMVTKETDAAVGPMLAHRAQQAGVVYTPVEGDQHGLLIALVEWARQLGLEVLCGGKARDAEYVYDRNAATVRCGQHVHHLRANDAKALAPLKPGTTVETVAERRAALMQPAQAIRPDHALPLHMANGNRLRHSLRAETTIQTMHVQEPDNSVLWRLRREQDVHFQEESHV